MCVVVYSFVHRGDYLHISLYSNLMFDGDISAPVRTIVFLRPLCMRCGQTQTADLTLVERDRCLMSGSVPNMCGWPHSHQPCGDQSNADNPL